MKCAISFAEQDFSIDRDVRLRIRIEVRNRDSRADSRSHRLVISRGGGKGPVAIAEKDGNVGVRRIDDDKVESAVVVQVGGLHVVRIVADEEVER